MTLFAVLLACGAPPEEPVFVVVAARELHVGVPIGEHDVYGLRMRPGDAPPDAFGDPAQVLGRVPSSTIYANEAIRGARLADAGMQAALAAMVPPELTVVTVPLHPSLAVAPTPARDKVDVWRDADLAKGTGERVASAVPILRVDGRSVAIMATDAQVEAIDAARGAGELTVAPAVAPADAPAAP